ncbi:unnamed protein product [Sphagnum jensenii]
MSNCVSLFLRSLKRQGRRSEMEEGTSLAAVFEQTRSYCLFPSLRMQERRSEMREGTITRRDLCEYRIPIVFCGVSKLQECRSEM